MVSSKHAAEKVDEHLPPCHSPRLTSGGKGGGGGGEQVAFSMTAWKLQKEDTRINSSHVLGGGKGFDGVIPQCLHGGEEFK